MRIKRYDHVKPAPLWGPARCSIRCPGTRHTCTLAKGHRGPHVAHGLFRRVVAVWDADARIRMSDVRRLQQSHKSSTRVPVPNASGARDFVSVLSGLWDRLRRRVPSPEEALLFVLGLGMVWMAIDIALRIMGRR